LAPRRSAERVDDGWLLVCPSEKWGVVMDGSTGFYRVRCKGKICRVRHQDAGDGPIFHVWSLSTLEMVFDGRTPYRNPRELREFSQTKE
jgi:hypothetical protein